MEQQAATNWDEELGEAAASILYDNMARMADVVDDSDTLLADAMKWLHSRDEEGLEALAEMASTLQAAKRAVALIESEVARTAGEMKREGVKPSGTLPSGQPYELRRAPTRKGWDHAAWKADALNAILEARKLGRYAVNPDTGEEVDLGEIIADAQNVHGSTSPRVSNLKALGLNPGDYCTETPGPWAFYMK